MWIKQVILDGFKSYAHRTVVGPFDREFNAITGLNGSGKSNVLDAICFAFAIANSNISQVRVKDLRELIYKSGHAGIHKASVTIDFDNTDVDQRPPGFDFPTITVTRQITVNGESWRNKFFINGNVAVLVQVQNLLHSVQLNVNNPHFLIMQGTITKVLNMKPSQRLAMLEEAAGTRMFEQKKLMAQKRLKEKDTNLAEIDRQLNDEMKPTLAKRERDRLEYDKYEQKKKEIEQLEVLKKAFDYEQLADACARLQREVDEARAKDATCTNGVEEMLEAIKELTAEIANMKSMHQKSLTYGLGASQKEYDDAFKALVTVETEQKNLAADVRRQGDLMKGLQTEQEKAAQTMEQYETTVKNAQRDAKKHDAEHAEIDCALDNLGRQLALLKSGIAASSEGVSLTEQLERYKKQLIAAEGNVKQADLLTAQSEASLTNKRKQAASSNTEYEKMKAQFAAEKAAYTSAEDALKAATGGYSEEKKRDLETKTRERQTIIATVEHEVRQLQTVVATRLNVKYGEGGPSPTVARGVKGVVAELMQVKDPKNMLAIGQASGTGLYNVVVDNEVTGKALVKEVRTRVTVIPLNKISSQRIPDDMVRLASSVAEKTAADATAALALDLIEYEDEVSAAMRFVFGRKIVCSSLDAATAVTFHKDIKQITVTLEGDVVQPGGSMQGGSMNNVDSILNFLAKLKDKRAELAAHQAELATLETDLEAMKEAQRCFKEQQTELELQKRKVESLEYKLSANMQHQTHEQIAKLEAQIEEAKASKETNSAKAAHLKTEIAKLQQKMKKDDGAADLGASVKDATKEIADMKAKQKALAPKRAEAMRIVAEADATKHEMQSNLARVGADREEEGAKLAEMESKQVVAQKQLDTVRALVAAKERTMNEQKAKLHAANSGLVAKEAEVMTLRDREAELRLAQQECKRKVADLEKQLQERQGRVAAMEKSPFVVQNKQHFGRKGGNFDWRSLDHVKEFSRLEAMKKSCEGMGRNIDSNVVIMYETVLEQYRDVVQKRETVQNDKSFVLNTITELNDQKRKTIKETFDRVKLDFCSIFSSLLPGASAELKAEYAEDETIISGVSIRVAMGKSWKDSLTELSGGQRSLLALSYILALLKYKPAPVYILDEVDAALDLSHTQNIGKMLSNHFKNSQFLVVSLKEGMFNNANVLFKVRLADGQSQIARHDNTKKVAAQKREGQKRAREGDAEGAKAAKQSRRG
eukprot:Rhum_TRINITY_DN4971_c0_g1::Rhum_TRINITY_DN4971_c0_g1_i1::g.16219::m.16219/K06674/SMC2; structural maintenance of chromosome 2